MERITYFFDGFNHYHALDEKIQYNKYKWLNYYKLAEAFTKKTQYIVSIYYFTAYYPWKPNSMKRHKKYVSALKERGVNVVLGKFKRKTKKCKLCGGICNDYYEEKQTDVNIALYVIREAIFDKYDTEIISSADSDLIPVFKTIRILSPSKRIGVLFPINRSSFDLKNEADFSMKIKEKHLKRCQLPEEIFIGNQKIIRPSEWT